MTLCLAAELRAAVANADHNLAIQCRKRPYPIQARCRDGDGAELCLALLGSRRRRLEAREQPAELSAGHDLGWRRRDGIGRIWGRGLRR
jgi:hypothetical protein